MTERRFNRILFNAKILLTGSEGHVTITQCIHFSEDGIDVKPWQSHEFPDDDLFHAGSVFSVQVADLPDAPVLLAAVVRSSSSQLGLKFLNEPA